ncbi:MAG: nucleotidyltransferase domain-containing protein [Nitrospirae bacterium]|nr:nucleotidyltransferase domain-containing protein [Nitrospirota bacterium]
MYSVTKDIPLNYNEQHALKGIINEVTSKYPIKKVILYGSKARGGSLEGSDIDILFITENNIDRSTRFVISDIIYNYELSNDVIVSAIFVSEADFRERLSTFLMRVKKEGIVIWSRE